MCVCACSCTQEFRRELEEEHKRELALLEAKLYQQMKHKLKVCTACFPPPCACTYVACPEMLATSCHLVHIAFTLPRSQSQEVRMIQSMAHACKLSNEQLAAEISSATAGELSVQLHT